MIKQQDWNNIPLQDLPSQIGDSKEDKILKNYINPHIIKKLLEKGINCINDKMSFSLILKKEGKINKKDAKDLIKTIFERIGKSDLFKKRTINRLNYHFKDLLLIYAASENPQVMLNIGNSYFAEFAFHKKFANKALNISQKWNDAVRYIQSIQSTQSQLSFSIPFPQPVYEDEVNVDDDQYDYDFDSFNMWHF